MKALNVLIVDDSKITIKRLAEMVVNAGHNVVSTATSGMLALSEYRKYKPDIVTMDITMPDMDGLEATKKLIEYDPNALVVMMTSHGQEQIVIESIGAGAKGYLLKPFDADRLKSVLEETYEKYGVKNA
ncbi:MAG: response regulator [Bacillota bacterium]